MSANLIKIIGSSLNTLSYISPGYASKKALDFFATPRKGRVDEKQSHFLKTAKQGEVQHKDLRIATYHWKGANKTILLVHGWESNTSRWKELIHELQELDYNIVGIDAPAHGNSDGVQFNAVLYSECIHIVSEQFKPEIIIGHSVGGMASGFFQHKKQALHLEKLILLGAPSEFSGVFKRYVEMMGYNKRIEEGLNAIILKRFKQEPSYFSLAEFSKNIDTKTLVIHDTDDKIIPYHEAELIHSNHRNAELITTTGFGHGLRRKPIYEHIINFISR